MSLGSSPNERPAPALRPPSGSDGRLLALVAWGVVYSQLVPFSDWVVALTRVDPNSHLGEAIRFFAYDTPKVLMLLTLVVFGMGVVRSFFSPEKTRALLAGKREGVGNVLAAALGIVTPFCSCSAVPLFIGFVSAGVPLGVTFSFLISAPMVNEVALGLLFGAGRLESGAHLSRLWPRHCHRLRLDHRPAASRTLAARNGFATFDRALSSFPRKQLSVVDRIKAGIDAVQGDRRQGLAMDHRGHCRRRLHPRLCAFGPAGLDHGPRRLVVGAGGGADRHPHVFERRRHHPRGRGADHARGPRSAPCSPS